MFRTIYSPYHQNGQPELIGTKEPVILGLNVTQGGYYSHNAGAALLREGEILALCEQERADRIKDSGRFPAEAAAICLKTAGLSIRDVKAVALAADPYFVAQRLGQAPQTDVIVKTYRSLLYRFGTVPAILVLVNHHLGHAASAFYPSGFAEALIVSWDGGGDNQSTVIYQGSGQGIRQIAEHRLSLGNLYSKFKTFLNLSDKGSLMGLASYGTKGQQLLTDYYDPINLTIHPALQFARGGEFIDDPGLSERLGLCRLPEEPIDTRHVSIAAQCQFAVEELCLRIVEQALEHCPSPHLCLSGGVALNATFNGLLWRKKLFKKIFIQPNATDGGLSLGAALQAGRMLTGRNPATAPMTHAYFGPEFGDAEIHQVLDLCRIPFRHFMDEAELVREIVGLLLEGKVVAWFQGRMEWGPRALGNRSILADPRSKAMADKVNAIIKYRDEWRPFAISILADRATEFMENPFPDPYMITTAPVKAEKQKELAAVVHADGTTRPQMVSQAHNPRYAALLLAFGRVTGVPGLLNTSFNIKGEPIVMTPKDALRTFYSSGLEALVMGNYLVLKA